MVSSSKTSIGPQSGEIWVVKIPNQPNDPHQPRPVIIVSTNSQNKHLTSVIAIPTSSSLIDPHPRFHIFLPKGTGGLTKDCYARCELITTLDKSLLIRGPLDGPLDFKYRWRLIEGVRYALGDTRVLPVQN